jgi:hypothetical protein
LLNLASKAASSLFLGGGLITEGRCWVGAVDGRGGFGLGGSTSPVEESDDSLSLETLADMFNSAGSQNLESTQEFVSFF